MLFDRGNKREEVNSAAIIIILLIFVVYSFWKNLIDSWQWVNFLFFIIICFVAHFIIKYFEKSRKESPLKLWKQFKYKYPIVTQYEPPKDLSPAEAWLLYNWKVDVTDLTSLIYRWNYEWLIDIKSFQWKDNWKVISKIQLTKLKDMENNRPFFEIEIYNSLFSASPKKIIWDSSQLRYALLLEDLEFHWIKKWWMYRKTWWWILKTIYIVFLILLYISLYQFIKALLGWLWWFWRLWTSVILLILCIFLWWYIDWWSWLKLTDKWAKLAAYIIWYRNFLKGCDENIIKAKLNDDPLFVDKTLPYATAFWLETEFINKVSPLAHDFKAQYIHWKKVTGWVKLLWFLLKSANKDRYNVFYRW